MERKVAQLEAEAACMYSAVVQACSRMLIVYCQLIPRRGDAARADFAALLPVARAAI